MTPGPGTGPTVSFRAPCRTARPAGGVGGVTSVAEAVLGTVGVGRWEARGRGPDSDGADQIPPPHTFLYIKKQLGGGETIPPRQSSLFQACPPLSS